MIFAGVVIDVCVSLGDNNIVRPHTYIGHNVRIGSHNYLAPGCAVAGHGVIGDLCYLGIRSTVIDHVVLENETLIGAGALVLKNTEPASTYLGHPARKTSEHPETGISMKGSSDGG
jgi:UDP-3-O-[3-hydroxymyristoyl] glucosamine N-acyltransferase